VVITPQCFIVVKKDLSGIGCVRDYRALPYKLPLDEKYFGPAGWSRTTLLVIKCEVTDTFTTTKIVKLFEKIIENKLIQYFFICSTT